MGTVLIVEDQEEIPTLAQSFLEEQGHKTLSAATADEALAILTGSEAVDLAVSGNDQTTGMATPSRCRAASTNVSCLG